MKQGGDFLKIGDAELRIGKAGGITLSTGGEILIADAFSCNLFRASTDNDGVRGWTGQEQKPLGLWLAAGLDRLRCIKRKLENDLQIIYYYESTAGVIVFRQRISAEADGMFRFEQNYEIPETFPTLPRIGVIASFAPGFEHFEWFGRGPWENYIDRRRAAQVGPLHGNSDGQFRSGLCGAAGERESYGHAGADPRIPRPCHPNSRGAPVRVRRKPLHTTRLAERPASQ